MSIQQHIVYTTAYTCIYWVSKLYLTVFLAHPARIEDDDPGYGSDAWTQYDDRTGEIRPLRADRLHRTPPEEVIDGDDVSGIRSQMWLRAMKKPWWRIVFPEGGLITEVMTHCDGTVFCMVTAENMDGIMTCPFFPTRLRATCLNSTLTPMPASICLWFLRTGA